MITGELEAFLGKMEVHSCMRGQNTCLLKNFISEWNPSLRVRYFLLETVGFFIIRDFIKKLGKGMGGRVGWFVFGLMASITKFNNIM